MKNMIIETECLTDKKCMDKMSSINRMKNNKFPRLSSGKYMNVGTLLYLFCDLSLQKTNVYLNIDINY